jgi:hypothetical protein
MIRGVQFIVRRMEVVGVVVLVVIVLLSIYISEKTLLDGSELADEHMKANTCPSRLRRHHDVGGAFLLPFLHHH